MVITVARLVLAAHAEQRAVQHVGARQFLPQPIVFAAQEGEAEHLVGERAHGKAAIFENCLVGAFIIAERQIDARNRHCLDGLEVAVLQVGVDLFDRRGTFFRCGAVAQLQTSQRLDRVAVDGDVLIVAVFLVVPGQRLVRFD